MAATGEEKNGYGGIAVAPRDSIGRPLGEQVLTSEQCGATDYRGFHLRVAALVCSVTMMAARRPVGGYAGKPSPSISEHRPFRHRVFLAASREHTRSLGHCYCFMQSAKIDLKVTGL
jgi:hypothetical protein